MPTREDLLAQAKRHVQEAEQRVLRQSRLIRQLERDGHEQLGQQAREVLRTLQRTLELTSAHLELEQRRAAKPD